MGHEKQKQLEAKDKNGKRGSVNNAGRLDAFAKRGGAASGDWGGCDAAKIQGVIMGITELGGAVTFGLSRDGGAHSVTLMLDGQRQTMWYNGDAELDAELDGVKATLEAMRE